MKHIMLDLETLGTVASAVIMSIGGTTTKTKAKA